MPASQEPSDDFPLVPFAYDSRPRDCPACRVAKCQHGLVPGASQQESNDVKHRPEPFAVPLNRKEKHYMSEATEKQPDINEVTVTFNAQQVSIVFAALAEAPYKIAQPVMEHIQAAIRKALDDAKPRIVTLGPPPGAA